jgi:hypothetical protein
VKAAGRRPRHQKQSSPKNLTSTQTNTPPLCHIDITGWLQDIPNVSQKEKRLLKFFLERPENLDCFVLGSTFHVAEQCSVVALLPAALPILKDAYLACAIALGVLQAGNETDTEEDNGLRYVSSAMATLMSLPVSTARDATLCLTLGAALVSYVYSMVGVGMADICRYCLSTTISLLETASDAESRPQQGFLALLEIMDCVVHRRKPTLRIQPQMTGAVDHHLGLCLPLLQYLYDICVINYTTRNRADMKNSVQIQRQWDEIYENLAQWQPLHCGDLIEKYEAAEVVNLLAQARIFRLSGFLLIHRSRYAFGQRDDQADIWSKEILMELELAHKVTNRNIPCVTLAFMVASVEIRDPNGRLKVLQNVDKFVDQFTPVVKEAITTFLSRVWTGRDMEITPCWFHSVCKPCVALESIKATSFA